MGAPFVGEAFQFLKDPFAFTLARTRQHGSVWKTRILGDTVVFFAGPKAFSFFMNPEHFTPQSGSPRFLQDLLHPDAVPFLDGERHRLRKQLLLSAFGDRALASYLPGIFAILGPAFLGWFTRNYDLHYPAQDASPGAGGLGPLPKSQLRVGIVRRGSTNQNREPTSGSL